MEVNKKREAELQRLRRDREEASVQSEALTASLRKRNSEAMAELSEQCEALQRSRAKLEKEKQNMRMEMEELVASVDSLHKAKVRTFISFIVAVFHVFTFEHFVCVLQMSSESQMKKLEEQLSEASRTADDLQRAQMELSVARNRLTGTSPHSHSRTAYFVSAPGDFHLLHLI